MSGLVPLTFSQGGFPNLYSTVVLDNGQVVLVADVPSGTTIYHAIDSQFLTVNAPSAGAVTEDAHASTETASGTIAFSDVDLTDTHSASAAFTSTTNSGGQLGSMTASVTTDTSNGTGGVTTWNYSVDDAAIQFLAAGQTVTETYTVTLADNNSGTTTQTVTVTITGTNDTPVITSSAQTGAITEADGVTGSTVLDTASGAVTFTDVDLSDTHAVTITGVAATGVTSGLADNITVLGWLSLGTLSDATNGATGSDAWTFSAQDKSFDYLAADETVTLTYTVQVADGHGGTASQNVAVTVTGTNDAPTITSGDATATGSVTEDQWPLVTQHLSASDVDHGDTLTWSLVPIGNQTVQTVGADYFVVADEFLVTKGGGILFDDKFSDNVPPPNRRTYSGGKFGLLQYQQRRRFYRDRRPLGDVWPAGRIDGQRVHSE